MRRTIVDHLDSMRFVLGREQDTTVLERLPLRERRRNESVSTQQISREEANNRNAPW